MCCFETLPGVSSGLVLALAPRVGPTGWFLSCPERKGRDRQVGWTAGYMEGLWPMLPAGLLGAVSGGMP